MDDYKVKYEDFAGVHVTEWMDCNRANAFFNKLGLNVVWAELIYSPTDDSDDFDGEQVVRQITNRIIVICGKRVIVPYAGNGGK